MNRPITAFLPFIIWIIVIFLLLVMPANDAGGILSLIPHADKLVHATIFGIMVILFGWAYRKESFKTNAYKIFLVAIVASLYGIAMEFVQKYFLPESRGYDEWDMLADCIGAFAGYFIIRSIILNKRQNNK